MISYSLYSFLCRLIVSGVVRSDVAQDPSTLHEGVSVTAGVGASVEVSSCGRADMRNGGF